MRYFTRELYAEMQQAFDSQDFQSKWDAACRREAADRRAARPFMDEILAYYVDLGWHDTYIDEIHVFEGDATVQFLIREAAADICLLFCGVTGFVNSTDSVNVCWLYDEFRRLDNGNFQWDVLMANGEISICFQKLEVSVERKSYIPQLLEEICYENACRNLADYQKQILEMYQGDETKLYKFKALLKSTYNREDILKRRITSAISSVAVYSRGKGLTDIERKIQALQTLVIALNEMFCQENAPWAPGASLNISSAGSDCFPHLWALTKEVGSPILRALIQEILMESPRDTETLFAVIGQFAQERDIPIEALYGEADGSLTRYVMKHMEELAG